MHSTDFLRPLVNAEVCRRRLDGKSCTKKSGRGPPFLNKIAQFSSSSSLWSYLRAGWGADSIGFVGGILERKRGNLFRKKDEKVQLLKRTDEG